MLLLKTLNHHFETSIIPRLKMVRQVTPSSLFVPTLLRTCAPSSPPALSSREYLGRVEDPPEVKTDPKIPRLPKNFQESPRDQPNISCGRQSR